MTKKKGRSPEDEAKLLTERVRKRRIAQSERERRQIECGIINGKVHENGGYIIYGTKGIQHWYDTRTLVNKVTEIMDRNENSRGERVCHINGKWQLQIRGKHLRRLLKAMPTVKQVGRTLVDMKTYK